MRHLLLVVGCCLIAAGCQSPHDVKRAVAEMEAKEGSEVKGVVTFEQAENGVVVKASIDGLKPGKHGFHIHEKGDCSAHDASSAGGHFNPTNEPHAGPLDRERHVGDLGNLEADANGHATYEFLDDVLELNGLHSIIGKSVVIHADPDDLKTQPTGNSGKRISCGPIKAL